jgi:hypothetical protein
MLSTPLTSIRKRIQTLRKTILQKRKLSKKDLKKKLSTNIKRNWKKNEFSPSLI